MTPPTSAARAAASRRNGARSRGPATIAGKARSARNALRHGLRAGRIVLLEDEDAGAFAALAGALDAELAPVGALQSELVARIAIAAWRARRADRLEAALLGRHLAGVGQIGARGDGSGPEALLGAGLIRDGNGPRALETLVRYRGSVLAELFRALAALKALQAEAEPADTAPAGAPGRPAAVTERTRENRRNQ